MPEKIPQDWDVLEQQLYAAGVDPAEVEGGARRLLAGTHGNPETREGYGLANREGRAVSPASGIRL